MNKEEILNYIKTLSNNEYEQKLLIKTIGKILFKQENSKNFIEKNNNKIIHIRDWIISVIENNEKWKNPRVLTIDALNNAADKYFEKKNNKLQTIELDEQQEKLIADLGEYYVVQMLTSDALDNESKVMQHCIGHGWYDRKLNDINYQYLSLRDKFNKAHVTMEIFKKDVLQIQGKQNNIPDIKYLDKLLPWLLKNGYKIDINKYNFVFNVNDSKIYSLFNIPDNCEVKNDLNLCLNNIQKLPKNLIVNGNLTINFKLLDDIFSNHVTVTDSIYLKMENWTENKELNFYNFDINESTFKRNNFLKFKKEEIPDNVFLNNKINIHLFFEYFMKKNVQLDLNKFNLIFNDNDKKIYDIDKIPDNCIINDDICFDELIKIEKLPKNLTINGNLTFKNITTMKIPDDLKVNGFISLCDVKFKQDILSKNLYKNHETDLLDIIKYLILEKKYVIDYNLSGLLLNERDNNLYPINDLPDHCIINHNLEYHYNTAKINKFPKHFTINGNLYIKYVSIKKMPEYLIVSNNLSFRESEFESFPDDLFVGGDVDLSKTNIKKINNIKLGGSLNLRNSMIEELPDNLLVGGDLNLYGCIHMNKLPENLIVENDLRLIETCIEELPENIKIKGSLLLRNSKIKKLPDNLEVENLDLRSCNNIEELPNNLVVRTSLYINKSTITKIPDNLKCRYITISEKQINLIPENFICDKIYIHDKNETINEYTRKEFLIFNKKI